MRLLHDMKMTVAEQFRYFPKGTTATIKVSFDSSPTGGFTSPVTEIEFHLAEPTTEPEAKKMKQQAGMSCTCSRADNAGASLWQEMEKLHAKKKDM